MRTRTFEIPQNIIPEFFQYAEQTELGVELMRVIAGEDDEEDVLEVEVAYEDRERKEIMNLIELIDDYFRGDEEEEN